MKDILKKIKSFLYSNGEIKRYNLQDWWFDKLNKKDRNEIKKSLNKNIQKELITEEVIYSELQLLAFIIRKLETKSLKLFEKIRDAGFIEIETKNDITIKDEYNFYSSLIYSLSNLENGNDVEDEIIKYCKKSIELSDKIIGNIGKDENLPEHIGFINLIEIYKNNKNLLAALELCYKGYFQGWKGDYLNLMKEIDTEYNMQKTIYII